ncbi:MAG TPA: glycosyltransferase [Solirubrobacteraceae bacterium]|nr:glycosyltransferase [Solirubrobacteraceae bacterium]
MYRASIVVPLLIQRDAWLRQCLLSAALQTASSEVIVVTSPRTPPSNHRVLADLKQRHRNLRVFLRPPNTAFAGALNAGIRAASTTRIGFLLSDDWLDDTAVAECLQFSSDIVSTGVKVYSADGITKLGEVVLNFVDYHAQSTLGDKANYLKYFFLFRKERLFEVGGVDETVGLTGPDDFDLIWTLLEHGATVSVLSRPLYNCRDHFGQRLTLRKRSHQVLDLLKILDKHGIQGDERRRLIAHHSIAYGQPWHVSERLRERR